MTSERTIVLELTNLPRLDWLKGKWCDPYVKLTVIKNETSSIKYEKTTEVKENTQEATFEKISIPKHDGCTYKFECWDEDKLELRDDFIGTAEFTTEEIFSNVTNSKTFDELKGGTLKVFKETQSLFLKVKLTDVVAHDVLGNNDIFIKVFQDGQEIRESDVIPGKFQTFKPFEVTIVDIEKPDLIIRAYDKDLLHDDEIGSYEVDVKTLKNRGVVRDVLR